MLIIFQSWESNSSLSGFQANFIASLKVWETQVHLYLHITNPLNHEEKMPADGS